EANTVGPAVPARSEQPAGGRDRDDRPEVCEHVRRDEARSFDVRSESPARCRVAGHPLCGCCLRRYTRKMEGGGLGGFNFGGDPEDLLRGLREFAEQQAESVQEAQREQFATLTLNTAVELTAAALGQLNVEGSSDEQAVALRDAMRVLFPEAVALVSAARQGFMRER